jgi:hypothetical protein
MKRIIAMILIGLLAAPPASAGEKQGKPIDWQKTQTLKPGTEIVLTVTGGQPTKVRLLFADETNIITLKPTAPKLPGRVKELLFSLGPKWPIVLRGGSVADGRLRVSINGVFDGDTKLADLTDVVQQTTRGDVREILGSPSHSTRNFWIAVAATAGTIVALVIWNIYRTAD